MKVFPAICYIIVIILIGYGVICILNNISFLRESGIVSAVVSSAVVAGVAMLVYWLMRKVCKKVSWAVWIVGVVAFAISLFLCVL